MREKCRKPCALGTDRLSRSEIAKLRRNIMARVATGNLPPRHGADRRLKATEKNHNPSWNFSSSIITTTLFI